MKDGKFETRAEIWRHLLNGGKVALEGKKGYLFLKNGEVYHSSGLRDTSAFDYSEKWAIYEEPKPKKKITLYRYTYAYGSTIHQTSFTSKNWSALGGEGDYLLLTESKEIEVDDV